MPRWRWSRVFVWYVLPLLLWAVILGSIGACVNGIHRVAHTVEVAR
jgi:hypothetical protein